MPSLKKGNQRRKRFAGSKPAYHFDLGSAGSISSRTVTFPDGTARHVRIDYGPQDRPRTGRFIDERYPMLNWKFPRNDALIRLIDGESDDVTVGAGVRFSEWPIKPYDCGDLECSICHPKAET